RTSFFITFFASSSRRIHSTITSMRFSICGRMEVFVAVQKKSRLKRIVLIAIIVVGAIGLFLYMQQKRRPKPLVLAGTLEARTVNVGSLVGGRVTRVLID